MGHADPSFEVSALIGLPAIDFGIYWGLFNPPLSLMSAVFGEAILFNMGIIKSYGDILVDLIIMAGSWIYLLKMANFRYVNVYQRVYYPIYIWESLTPWTWNREILLLTNLLEWQFFYHTDIDLGWCNHDVTNGEMVIWQYIMVILNERFHIN